MAPYQHAATSPAVRNGQSRAPPTPAAHQPQGFLPFTMSTPEKITSSGSVEVGCVGAGAAKGQQQLSATASPRMDLSSEFCPSLALSGPSPGPPLLSLPAAPPATYPSSPAVPGWQCPQSWCHFCSSTSSSPCWHSTAWAGSHRSHRTQGGSDPDGHHRNWPLPGT